jgi:uncharacterized protein YdaU (DUF1376 family)
MNYYKRHIGDYMKDAGHLSLLEHGVYTRLMDVYYTRETGIPVDQAARLIGARSKDELAALAQVTQEFFSVVDGCYTQGRCVRVIGEMLDKAETNRVIGKRGGRPKKQTETVVFDNPEITQMVSENNPDVTLATSHKPLTNRNTGGDARATRLPTTLTPPAEWLDFVQTERPDLNAELTYAKFCDYWSAKPGKAGTKLNWLATWRNWVREEKRQVARAATGEPAWRTEQRNRTLQAVPNLLDRGQSPAEFFDVESKNVTTLALG